MSIKFSRGYIRSLFIFTALVLSVALFQGCEEAYDASAIGGGGVSTQPAYTTGASNVTSISGIFYGSDESISLAPSRVPGLHSDLSVSVLWSDDDTGISQTVSTDIDETTGAFTLHGLPGGTRTFILTLNSGNVPVADFPVICNNSGSTAGLKEYKYKVFIDVSNNTLTATQMEIAFVKDNDSRTTASFRMQAFERKTLKDYGSGSALASALSITSVKDITSLSAMASMRHLNAFDESDYYYSAIYNVPGMDVSANDLFSAYKDNLLLTKHRFENRVLKDLGDDDDFSSLTTLNLIQDYMVYSQYVPSFAEIGDVEVILEPSAATSEASSFKVGDTPRLALIFDESSRERDLTIITTIEDSVGNKATRRVVLVDDSGINDDGTTATDVYAVSDRISLIPTLGVLSNICTLEGAFLKTGDYTLNVELTGLGGDSWVYSGKTFRIYGQDQDSDKHIFGTVAYTGEGTGEIRVAVYGDSAMTTQLLASATLTEPGRFQISGLKTTPVYAIAYQDQNSNLSYDHMNGEPFGAYQSETVWDGIPDAIDLSSSVSDINISIHDGYTFEIVDLTAEVSIGSGSDEVVFENCTKVKVTSGGDSWYRYYASRYGLIKDGNKVLDSASLQPDDTLFPLAVGNKWRYKDTTISSIEIIGTETVNGYMCYKALILPEDAIAWYRVQGNDVLQAGYRRPGKYHQNFRMDVKEMELVPSLGSGWGR